jgi:hypothetical protein
MSRKQTEKSRFPSKYSNSFISASQYITELLCEKIAKNQGKKLPYKFWDLHEWNKIYCRHIVEAHKLVKQYEAEVLIRALNDPQMRRMNSFLFPPFLPLVKQYQKRLRQEKSYTPPKSSSPPNVVNSDGIARDKQNRLRNILNG